MKKLNLVFIVCDALRFDRLHCYGYGKDTSPNIDKLAENGVLFENAFGHINTTAPSFTSILTGRYPWTTGITKHFAPENGKACPTEYTRNQNLDAKFKMLAEILYRNGYNTYSSEWLGEWFKRGNIWTMPSTYFEGTYPECDKLVDWALTRISEKPYFIFLHPWEAHWPPTAPRKYADMFYDKSLGDPEDPAKIASLDPIKQSYFPESWENFRKTTAPITSLEYMFSQYDGDVRFMDEQLGRLLDAVGDDTLIVLTSDHGENLGDHGLYFVHYGLYDSVIHVPLIFHNADRIGKGVKHGLVEHVDLVPTILKLLDVKPDEGFDGVDMFDEGFKGKEAVYSIETRTRDAQCVRNEEFKLVAVQSSFAVQWRPVTPIIRYELYNLKNDPKEEVNVAMKNMNKVAEMDALLRRNIR